MVKYLSVSTIGTVALAGWTLSAMADPKPLSLGEEYYPPESRRLHEEGVCVVKITVTAEGVIEDPTLTKSTGYSRLDDACVAGFRGQHMKPSMRDGKPTTVTAEVPLVWKLNSPDQERIRVNPNHLPRIGKQFYPTESLRGREEGVCVVKVSVSAHGDVHVLGLSHSTGFARLDQACLEAYSNGALLPAAVGGVAIDSIAELPVAWRLGGS